MSLSSKICSILIAISIFSSCSFATSVSDFTNSDSGVTINGEDVVENVEEGIGKVTTGVNSFAMTVIEQISDKSLPVCAILILWGAVLYFIQGIRNLYKKRQGLLLMWGSFTFLVIAKFVNLLFWFIFAR